MDAATIKSIQRMLDVRILDHREIAREAGVSANTVAEVAAGRRQAVSMSSPMLNEGEQALSEPIRRLGAGHESRSSPVGHAEPGERRAATPKRSVWQRLRAAGAAVEDGLVWRLDLLDPYGSLVDEALRQASDRT